MNDYTLKVYFVMTSGQLDRLERFAKGGYFRRILTSFAYKEIIDKFAEHLGPEECKKLDVFVDSGAFTVMTQGITINVDDYANYLKEFSSRYKFNTLNAFNLDVIPDLTEEEKVNGISEAKMEGTASASWDNYEYLTKEKGFDFIVPVYHAGEGDKWLQKIVESGCKYFAFGGVSGKIKSTTVKKDAFASLFTRLQELNYTGHVHMLGLCMPDVLCSHGWYSVDATITKSAGYGHIYMFDSDSREKVKVVPVSETRPGSGSIVIASEHGLQRSNYITLEDRNELLFQLKEIGMEGTSLATLGDPEGGFWLRVEACFRSWSMFEDWVNKERRRLDRFQIYDTAHQKKII